MQRLDELAGFSEEKDRLSRVYLSPAYNAAAARLVVWMWAAGMDASIDPVGNVIGRYPGLRNDAPPLVLGSHFDTVRNAGRYDGNFGVLAAIAVVADLHARGERLAQPIEVVAFGDEEGVRFPTTMLGSRAYVGRMNADDLGKCDADGISVRAALSAAGLDADAYEACARAKGDIAGYLEIHIEQGPVLEASRKPLGIVTAIAGATRARIEVGGEAGHAGTVPMGLRRDALTCASEMILAVERIARTTPGLVATVGVIEVRPRAANVIPASAGFSLDVRSADDEIRRMGLTAIRAAFRDICEQRHTSFMFNLVQDSGAVQCAPDLAALCADAIGAVGEQPLQLVSGAGHDAMMVAHIAPVAMLFVRCKGGISHNPAESITVEDADIGVRAFSEAVRLFGAQTHAA